MAKKIFDKTVFFFSSPVYKKSMPTGLTQLSYIGAADQLLTANPDYTFFKAKIKRHSLFAMSDEEGTWSGSPDFNNKATCIVSRQGDLLHQVWLQVELPHVSTFMPGDTAERRASFAEKVAYCNNIGHALIRSVECELGGVRIDYHTSDYLDLWSELTTNESVRHPYFTQCLGKFEEYDPRDSSKSFKGGILMIPLQFWFNRAPHMALPLSSIVYHEVRLNFDFRGLHELLRIHPDDTNTALPISSTQTLKLGDINPSNLVIADSSRVPSMDVKIYLQYIFVDTPERKIISSGTSEYLIDVVQFLGDNYVSVRMDRPTKKINIDFSHPVKELIWAYSPKTRYNGNIATLDHFYYGLEDHSVFTDIVDAGLDPYYAGMDYSNPYSSEYRVWTQDEDPFESLKITLNGSDRVQSRPGKYFRLCQPMAHHTRIPTSKTKKIMVFSFALHPESVGVSSGSLNFSRIDSSTMSISFHRGIMQGRVRVYARSINLLRISKGLTGLAFSS
jgi:hypothetical protein